jgi:hypothetical protein
MIKSIEYRYRNEPPTVTIVNHNDVTTTWTVEEFEADQQACLNASDVVEEISTEPVPKTITASQARVALHRLNLLAGATALVDAPETHQEIKIFWEYEVELNRDSPALNLMATALGLTSEALDELFRVASKITV